MARHRHRARRRVLHNARRRTPRRPRTPSAGPGLPRRGPHACCGWPPPALGRASAPTAPTSASTSGARSRPPTGSRTRVETIAHASREAQGERSSATASAACWPAVWPRGVPTSSRGIVTMGSPMVSPGAAHDRAAGLATGVLTPADHAGLPRADGVDCVARRVRAGVVAAEPGPAGRRPGFTAVYSRRDGIVDWRALHRPGGASPSRSPPATSGWRWTRSSSTGSRPLCSVQPARRGDAEPAHPRHAG